MYVDGCNEHCVENLRRTASSTWTANPKRSYKYMTLQKEGLRLNVPIWAAYSSCIERNENKSKNQNISHKA